MSKYENQQISVLNWAKLPAFICNSSHGLYIEGRIRTHDFSKTENLFKPAERVRVRIEWSRLRRCRLWRRRRRSSMNRRRFWFLERQLNRLRNVVLFLIENKNKISNLKFEQRLKAKCRIMFTSLKDPSEMTYFNIKHKPPKRGTSLMKKV